MSIHQADIPDTAEAAIPATETVETCVLCGATGTEPMVDRAVDRLHRLPGEFAFVRCTGCGLARLSPRPLPSEIGFYYPSDYYSYHCVEPAIPDADPSASDAEPAAPPGRLRAIRSRLREAVLAHAGYADAASLPPAYRALTPLIFRMFKNRVFMGRPGFPIGRPPGRALDVGCGSGQFMRLLQFFGWEVAGVEIDAEALETAGATTSGEVFAGEVQDAPFPQASFDFIHMSHVIEHMADPVASMRTVASLLKPGGLVYIECPNGESWNTRHCKEYWFGYDAPRHLHMFSPETLAETVESVGLAVDRRRTWWFPGIFRWEDTYRQEDERGGLLPADQRPRMRLGRRPRAAGLWARGSAAHLRDRMNADILAVWAHRP